MKFTLLKVDPEVLLFLYLLQFYIGLEFILFNTKVFIQY